MNKKVKVIFTISLVTNILLLGMLGGQAYRMKQDGRSSWGALREQLKPETATLMKQIFKDKKYEVFQIFKEVRQKKAALIDIFSAEVFDAAAYDVAAQDLQQLGMKISSHKLETFKELGAQLPQEERQKLAQKLVSSVLGKHWRKGKKGRHSPRDQAQHENRVE
ncbi:MAG: hypothetical protein COA45_02145 [Zetaproteobacteria bacterium]|nr:MAG: hypothetical protein COA45_02145 [Zetaproteobacteria bacterium]